MPKQLVHSDMVSFLSALPLASSHRVKRVRMHARVRFLLKLLFCRKSKIVLISFFVNLLSSFLSSCRNLRDTASRSDDPPSSRLNSRRILSLRLFLSRSGQLSTFISRHAFLHHRLDCVTGKRGFVVISFEFFFSDHDAVFA